MLAQRAAFVVGPEDPAFLQQRHDRGRELVETARRDVRHQDEPVAGVSLDVAVDRFRDGARAPAKDCLPVTSMISSRIDRPSACALARHCAAVASGSRYIRTLARQRAMVFSPGSGSKSGSGPSGE